MKRTYPRNTAAQSEASSAMAHIVERMDATDRMRDREARYVEALSRKVDELPEGDGEYVPKRSGDMLLILCWIAVIAAAYAVLRTA